MDFREEWDERGALNNWKLFVWTVQNWSYITGTYFCQTYRLSRNKRFNVNFALAATLQLISDGASLPTKRCSIKLTRGKICSSVRKDKKNLTLGSDPETGRHKFLVRHRDVKTKLNIFRRSFFFRFFFSSFHKFLTFTRQSFWQQKPLFTFLI